MSTAYVNIPSAGRRAPSAGGTLRTPSAPSASGARRRLRLTRRGRAVLTTLVALPLAAAAVLGILGGGAASASDPAAPVHPHYVTVLSGESLWSIAESMAPGADPRNVIAAIVTVNRLSDATVVPGERLVVPPQYEGAQ